MRATIVLAALCLCSGLASADHHEEQKLTAQHEPGAYRFGAPYRTLTDTHPQTCAEVCDSDQKCSAWVYVPTAYERAARCDLKSLIGAVERRPGAISGIAMRHQPVMPEAVELAGGPDDAPNIKPDLPEEDEDDPVFTIDPVKGEPLVLRGKEIDLTEAEARPVKRIANKMSSKAKTAE